MAFQTPPGDLGCRGEAKDPEHCDQKTRFWGELGPPEEEQEAGMGPHWGMGGDLRTVWGGVQGRAEHGGLETPTWPDLGWPL